MDYNTPLNYGHISFYASSPKAEIEAPAPGDAGIDLRTIYEVSIPPIHTGENPSMYLNDLVTMQTIQESPFPKWIHKFHTGIHMAIPEGFYGFVTNKSSVAAGKPSNSGESPDPFGGLIVLGGIIDSSYRGEIIVALGNLTTQTQRIVQGQKIAQMIVQQHVVVQEMSQVLSLDELGKTDRGQGGFGSTSKV